MENSPQDNPENSNEQGFSSAEAMRGLKDLAEQSAAVMEAKRRDDEARAEQERQNEEADRTGEGIIKSSDVPKSESEPTTPAPAPDIIDHAPGREE